MVIHSNMPEKKDNLHATTVHTIITPQEMTRIRDEYAIYDPKYYHRHMGGKEEEAERKAMLAFDDLHTELP